MSHTETINQLKNILADSYALYIKTQNYHWNVEGPHFKSLHLLFEEQYNDLALAVDTIAERIRALGAKAPGNWTIYKALTIIADGNENATAEKMVRELAEDQVTLDKRLKQALEAAQSAHDAVTEGLLVERLTVHEKNGWMLRSSV